MLSSSLADRPRPLLLEGNQKSNVQFAVKRTYHSLSVGKSINPFPNKPWFLRVCSKYLLKTLWEKEKLLYLAISHFPSVFSTHLDNFLQLSMQFTIVVCKLFEFGIVQNLSFTLDLYPRIPTFNNPQKESFRKRCGKMRKCL